MADITMCLFHDCRLKQVCHRYTALKNEFWQSYFVDDPRKSKESKNNKEYCAYFWVSNTLSSNFMLKLLKQSDDENKR